MAKSALLIGLFAVASTSALKWPFGWDALHPDPSGVCAGRGAYDGHKCHCFSGWTGVDCDIKDCQWGPSRCLHGTCNKLAGTCSCDYGWTGPTCSEPTCPNDCSGHGSCVGDGPLAKCACAAGFGGADCSWPCPQECSAHGTCTKQGCVCDAGYVGPSCGRVACPGEEFGAACSNRGVCYEGRCQCRQPYGGADCSINRPTSAAAPALTAVTAPPVLPLHAGPCAGQDGDGMGPINPNKFPCGPNGRCERHSELCICFSGWAVGSTGKCDKPVCTSDCSGRGTCVDGKCACRDGWRGTDCSVEPMCPRGIEHDVASTTTTTTTSSSFGGLMTRIRSKRNLSPLACSGSRSSSCRRPTCRSASGRASGRASRRPRMRRTLRRAGRGPR